MWINEPHRSSSLDSSLGNDVAALLSDMMSGQGCIEQAYTSRGDLGTSINVVPVPKMLEVGPIRNAGLSRHSGPVRAG